MRLARTFGATDVLYAAEAQTAATVVDWTGGGAAAVVECVGGQPALDLALTVAHAYRAMDNRQAIKALVRPS
ncbi:zinc-binding dehydrogenase [Micromonospora sp. ATCC 39149]|uniref:zinc-binding dehydrogenase n=1 Tax=Micromonospora sp. (strain ATCC 39149 / NRRL 15099 / SCC 1413) TaxID=219305 RepID=UPI0009FFBC15